VLAVYNAVHNALPGYQKVVLMHAYSAVKQGADHDALAAMLTENAQQATKWYLAQPKFLLHPAPCDDGSVNAWEAMVPCKVCGKPIGWDEVYVHVLGLPGYICHLTCTPKGTLKVGGYGKLAG